MHEQQQLFSHQVPAPSDTMSMGKTPTKAGHMLNNRPVGGNILFVDGHAAWRRFRNMRDWHLTSQRDVRFWFYSSQMLDVKRLGACTSPAWYRSRTGAFFRALSDAV